MVVSVMLGLYLEPKADQFYCREIWNRVIASRVEVSGWWTGLEPGDRSLLNTGGGDTGKLNKGETNQSKA